jgi:zinc protease
MRRRLGSLPLVAVVGAAVCCDGARARFTPVLDATSTTAAGAPAETGATRSPVQVWYKVGSRNEPGATGLAHFLEHMMFKGTPTHGKGEFSQTVEENGGQDNAFTSQDVTSYYVNIASDRVSLILGLEADRMRNLLLEAGEIDSERQVVAEERRTRTEDDPDGYLSEEFLAAAYKAHPYGWPIIGWMSDILRINPTELRAFYNRYYLPNNALLVVGDIRRRICPSASRHLRSDPAGPAPCRHRGGAFARRAPDHPAQRRRAVADLASPGRCPTIGRGRGRPRGPGDGAGGRSAARLYRRLVVEGQLALDADADFAYGSVDPNLFWLSARPRPGVSLETLERALLEELDRLKREPVAADELERAKNQIEAGFVWGQDSIYARGATLARFERMGSWRLADGFVAQIRTVTAMDVQRVAREYFRDDARTVGVLVPAPAAAP